MNKVSRVLVTGIAAAALSVGTAGIAGADTAVTTQDNTSVWLLPGLDLGVLLAPTTAIPGALAPVFDLLRFIGG